MALFLITWLLVGIGAVVGSMVGAAMGDRALFVGALIGGAIASAAAVRVAEWRGWVAADRRWRVILGTLIGFAIASLIATRTLSSPIGPALSSLLIGAGAILANRR